MSNDRYFLKHNARLVISSARPSMIVAALIYIAVSLLLSTLSSSALGVNVTQDLAKSYLTAYMNADFDKLMVLLGRMAPPRSAYLVVLAIELVTSILGAGFVIFVFNTIRKAEPSYGNLLDGFALAVKIILLELLQGVVIFALSLLFIAPGIIAAYSYSMSLYILIDRPETGVIECMRQSRTMMRGHKWEFFCLQLSFFGWYMLTMIPYVGYGASVWTTPYTVTTYVLYYMSLKGESFTLSADPPQDEYM